MSLSGTTCPALEVVEVVKQDYVHVTVHLQPVVDFLWIIHWNISIWKSTSTQLKLWLTICFHICYERKGWIKLFLYLIIKIVLFHSDVMWSLVSVVPAPWTEYCHWSPADSITHILIFVISANHWHTFALLFCLEVFQKKSQCHCYLLLLMDWDEGTPGVKWMVFHLSLVTAYDFLWLTRDQIISPVSSFDPHECWLLTVLLCRL